MRTDSPETRQTGAVLDYIEAEMEAEDDIFYALTMTKKGNAGRVIYFKGPLAARFKGKNHKVFILAVTDRRRVQTAMDRGIFDVKDGGEPVLILMTKPILEKE